MPKIKCSWTTCKYNTSEYANSSYGHCSFDGELELRHENSLKTYAVEEDDSCLVCNQYKSSNKAMEPRRVINL